MSKKTITVIIAAYNESIQIYKSINVIHAILRSKEIKHNFVIIDDGSVDDTWSHIKNAISEFADITAIRFSRNFGKEAAIYAGLESASGDACILIDADLQHPPELIPTMVKLWQEEDFEIIEGIKISRGKESIINSTCSKLFYFLMKTLSKLNLNGASDFKLLDRKAINACCSMNESKTFFRGIATWIGFKHTQIPFEVNERTHGQSKWDLLKLFILSINAITYFTSVPLQLVTFTGFLFFFCSMIIGIHTLINYFSGQSLSGFTTVILLQLIIGSIIMVSIGVVGTYISRIFEEVKSRPRYIISESINTK